MKQFIIIGGIFGFLAVAFGAFGAHALRDKLSPVMLETFKTGVQYQMYHAFALLAVGILLKFFPESQALTISGYLFTAGILLFSGSLYGLSITEIKAFGPVTPFGGLSFLAGWVMLMIGIVRAN